jgi:hypothetical protein
MCVGRLENWGSAVSDSEVLVMFVTVYGEDSTRKIFKRAKNVKNLNVRKRK